MEEADLKSVHGRLELERAQESLRHKQEGARQEYASLDVAAPSRTIDVSGREYR